MVLGRVLAPALHKLGRQIKIIEHDDGGKFPPLGLVGGRDDERRVCLARAMKPAKAVEDRRQLRVIAIDDFAQLPGIGVAALGGIVEGPPRGEP